MSYLFFKTHILAISILMITGVTLSALQSTDIGQNTLNMENKNTLSDVESEVILSMFFAANINPFLPYSTDTSLSPCLLSNNTIENTAQDRLDDILTNDLDINYTNPPGNSDAFSNNLYPSVFNSEDAGSSAVGETGVVFDVFSQKTSKANISNIDNINILSHTADEFDFQTSLNHNAFDINDLDLSFLDEEHMFNEFEKNIEFSDLIPAVVDTNSIFCALNQKDSASVLGGSDDFTQKVKEAAYSTQQSNQGKSKIDINLKNHLNEGGNITIAHLAPNQKENCNYNVDVSSKEPFSLLATDLPNTCANGINSYCNDFNCINNRLGNNNELSEQVGTSEPERFFPTRQLWEQELDFICDKNPRKRRRPACSVDEYNPLKKNCTVTSKPEMQPLFAKKCIPEKTDRQVSKQELNTLESKLNISQKELSSIDGLTGFFQPYKIPEVNIKALGIGLTENPPVVLSNNNHPQKREIFISKDGKKEETPVIGVSELFQKRPSVNSIQDIHYYKLTEKPYRNTKVIKEKFYITKVLLEGIIFESFGLNDIDLSQIKTREEYFFSFLKINKINIGEYIGENKTPETHLKPNISIFKLEEKNSCLIFEYIIQNIPYFFVDCFFEQTNGIIVKSVMQQVNKQSPFLSSLNISVEISQSNSFTLRSLIPNLLLKHQETNFCGYFSEIIKHWNFTIKYFISDEAQEIKTEMFSGWKSYEYPDGVGKTNRNIYVRHALKRLKDSCIHDNISDFENLKEVKSILIKFRDHMEKISELVGVGFSSIIVEIRRALKLFQGQRLIIFTNKNYTKEDCELLTLYFLLSKNYVHLVESLLHINDTYLIK
ncbi:hypothetical protein CDIK_1627 [Cucumispora dikerogammari]|nr:hypothetical protein CDIK_1627 [Cucumispora dikerogammari]